MTSDSDVASELTAMATEQKELMLRTRGGAIGPASPKTRRERREVFVRHADRLKELLEEYGWPSAARVGEQASPGAWLVAQHADAQLDVQRLAVRLLREAVHRGEASRSDLVFLQDRVAVNEGRLQRYGTQIADVVDGQPVPCPCEDPEHLDERRAEVDIEPFAVNAARYTPPANPDTPS